MQWNTAYGVWFRHASTTQVRALLRVQDDSPSHHWNQLAGTLGKLGRQYVFRLLESLFELLGLVLTNGGVNKGTLLLFGVGCWCMRCMSRDEMLAWLAKMHVGRWSRLAPKYPKGTQPSRAVRRGRCCAGPSAQGEGWGKG